MAARTYKKYMKKNTTKDYSLLKLFIFSFFAMLLVFTFIIKSFTSSVDVSIGDYKQEPEIDNTEEVNKIITDKNIETLNIKNLKNITDEERENNQDYLTIMYNNLELIKKELYKNS